MLENLVGPRLSISAQTLDSWECARSVIARANSLQPEFTAICLEASGAECSGFSCQRGQILQNCAAKTLLHMRNHGDVFLIPYYSRELQHLVFV